jgi:hypothetical protein
MLWGTLQLTQKGRQRLWMLTPHITMRRTLFPEVSVAWQGRRIQGWYVRVCLIPVFFLYWSYHAPDDCQLGTTSKFGITFWPGFPEPGGIINSTWWKEWSFVSLFELERKTG